MDPRPRGQRGAGHLPRAGYRVHRLLAARARLPIREIKSIDDLDENDFRRRNPRFTGENFARNVQQVDRVREIAGEKGITPAQLALAWVLHQGVVPIPGTKRVRYLEENVAAVDVKLSDDELARIEAAAPVGAAAGDRYRNMSSVHV